MNSTIRSPAKLEAEAPPKRQAILDAALAQMIERGFHGTTMPEVAQAAGVGIGTIYRYFADKEALGNALFQECKTALADALWRDFPALTELRARFDEVWRRMTAFAAARPLMLGFCELHHHASYLDARSREIEQRIVEPAIELLIEGQRRRLLRPLDPELMAAMVWGMMVGVCTQAPRPFDPELMAAAGDCAWAAIALPRS